MNPSLDQIINKYKEYSWFKNLDFNSDILEFKKIDLEKDELIPKIVLIGEFSVGKSSIINNMLNTNILPIGWAPETRYVTEIKYSKENYILVEGKRFELTTENIKNIKTSSSKIEIFMNKDILKEVSFIDTPGTNDPTTYSDDIVFDVISNSDVVLFITKAIQAFTNSEKIFLSKVIKARDLERFFFIINFADLVENRKVVKNEFISNLSSLLPLDRNTIETHTFLYSVKEKEIYDYILKELLDNIKNTRGKMLEQIERDNKIKIIDGMLLKVQYVIDSLDGKASQYDKQLEEIKKEIELVEKSIEPELKNLQLEIERLKQTTIQNLRKDFEAIKRNVEQEIMNLDYKQLTDSRYIELRVKKLVEDAVENEWNHFAQSSAKLISDFDKRIDTYVINSLSLPMLQKTKTDNMVKTVAPMGALGITATTMWPLVHTALIGAAGLGAVGIAAPFLSWIPIVGTIVGTIAGAASAASEMMFPVIGAVAISVGRIVYDISKWGIGKAGEAAQKMEEKVYKQKFVSSINKQLDDLLKQLLSEIEKSVNIQELKEQYIKAKFPQKQALEEKIKLLNTKKIDIYKDVQMTKSEVSQLYQELEEFKSGL